MMNILFSVGLMAYGVYMIATGGVAGHDYVFWVKVAAAVGGGLYLLVSESKLKLSVASKTKDIEVPNLTTYTNVITVESLLPNDLEKKDNECLIYVKNRLALAKSEEGLATLSKLDETMFKLPRLNGE